MRGSEERRRRRDLQATINRYLAEANRDPKPFVWTADPDKIMRTTVCEDRVHRTDSWSITCSGFAIALYAGSLSDYAARNAPQPESAREDTGISGTVVRSSVGRNG